MRDVRLSTRGHEPEDAGAAGMRELARIASRYAAASVTGAGVVGAASGPTAALVAFGVVAVVGILHGVLAAAYGLARSWIGMRPRRTVNSLRQSRHARRRRRRHMRAR